AVALLRTSVISAFSIRECGARLLDHLSRYLVHSNDLRLGTSGRQAGAIAVWIFLKITFRRYLIDRRQRVHGGIERGRDHISGHIYPVAPMHIVRDNVRSASL